MAAGRAFDGPARREVGCERRARARYSLGALRSDGDVSRCTGYPAPKLQDCVRMLSDDRQYAPATLRNRDFILDVLRDVLPTTRVMLEVASESGEHVVHCARNLPSLVFQPSDPDPDARLSVGRPQYSLRDRRSISTVHTYAGGSQRRRAIKRSTRTYEI